MGLLNAVEKLTGKALSQDEKTLISHGADEIDLVNSGLEETMINAYDDIHETLVSTDGLDDLRTAAFVSSINKIAVTYMQLGIFP